MKTQTLKISNRKRGNRISMKFDKKEISLDKYAGQWVAFLRRKIVGNSKSLKKLFKEMEKKRIEGKVTFFPVPKKGVIHIY
ncbi:MAG: DUF5678 domain-containing protein [Patescibacteria group bacterium]|nr:DUF5678 domain-containing protein [Patescibacteria group bacterium]